MKSYSQDLRERVIAVLEAGDLPPMEVAEFFGIALSTLEKWWARWRTTGSCAAQVGPPGRKRVLAACETLLRAQVAIQPDIGLEALCEQVQAAGAVAARPSRLCRELARLALPRKKNAS